MSAAPTPSSPPNSARSAPANANWPHGVLADLEQGMLVIFDRGFYSYDFFAQARQPGRTCCFGSPPA